MVIILLMLLHLRYLQLRTKEFSKINSIVSHGIKNLIKKEEYVLLKLPENTHSEGTPAVAGSTGMPKPCRGSKWWPLPLPACSQWAQQAKMGGCMESLLTCASSKPAWLLEKSYSWLQEVVLSEIRVGLCFQENPDHGQCKSVAGFYRQLVKEEQKWKN